jgi:polyisoprenoid-binding protein YceI
MHTQTLKEHHMTSTRTLDGIDIPTAGTWTIDPSHADVAFIGRHFGLTKIRGRFTGVSGSVVIADRPTDSTVTVDIDMTSVSSGDQSRDDHLRSADFFDVEHHTTATYRSTTVDITGTTGTMTGDLTIKGVTNPVTLNISFEGAATDPWGGQRAVFTANGQINREDWGLTWNMLIDAGGLLVSKQIQLEIDVELVLQTP